MSKVVVIGAGNVGATASQYIVDRQLADVVLIDIVEGLPQGKALDLLQAGSPSNHDCSIIGTNNYVDTKDADIVVMTAGIARKPGMSRDDLLKTNANIVQSSIKEAHKYSPNAIFVVVTNPLDVMTQLVLKTTKLPSQRVIGMAGVLDSARFETFIAMELKVSVKDVRAMVLGGHGDLMVPVTSLASVAGIPLLNLIDKDTLAKLIKRTQDGGAEIVSLLKTGSAFYAPGASVAFMVEAILRDQNRLMAASVCPNGEYGLKDLYIGLPCILGANGVKKIVELELADNEMADLKKSATAIKDTVNKMNELLVAV